jgi:hypothetical protein
MLPASVEFGVPGADDDMIFGDIVRSLGRDRGDVVLALTELDGLAGGSFADLDDSRAERSAMTYLDGKGKAVMALGRAVLQCYYRDDRVLAAAGLEPRAPFPRGHVTPQGDWSLLDPVRRRSKMWRDVDAEGA